VVASLSSKCETLCLITSTSKKKKIADFLAPVLTQIRTFGVEFRACIFKISPLSHMINCTRAYHGPLDFLATLLCPAILYPLGLAVLAASCFFLRVLHMLEGSWTSVDEWKHIWKKFPNFNLQICVIGQE
jgi:hypothetical protein